ncbi:MAG: NADP-dependent malic enzyme [Ignavibacteria bacterium]|nr:NADP-dependent malic enzyme [Ignavibacteria bacterium]MBL7991032.1 NADP-dependent malic enzyme [Candidatus Kapabacteria bacterium]
MKQRKIRVEEALEYHSSGRKGKIEVIPTKPCNTQFDLSLAYSPGVAEPCRAIAENEELVYEYTAKGNLVAVISNGTAVLGLGNIGASAGKPVMEGKGVLFKKFADIDVFDIEIKTQDPEEFINTVANLEPTFGGINLEDIKAPECFYIEQELQRRMNIPVMHDDQHGTAIISSAGLLNACEIQGKKLEEIKVIVSGAGASAIACSNLYIKLGVKRENIFMFDSKGLVHRGRTIEADEPKAAFINGDKDISLVDAMKFADVFLGLSKGGLISKEMVASMPPKPILFALANPDPEIPYYEAASVRNDIICATGRSDNPNQVNNVLGFPYIFRGALDVRAKAVNDEMKLAAVYAIAKLTKESVPDSVLRAYGGEAIRFGKEYIIPKPFDSRVLTAVAPAVAKAAIDSGVARITTLDLQAYKQQLEGRQAKKRQLLSNIAIGLQTRNDKKRIVLTEGEEPKIIRAAEIIADDGIASPILIGRTEVIQRVAAEQNINLESIRIIDTLKSPDIERYATFLASERARRGMTIQQAQRLLTRRIYYGTLMVAMGDADGMISGLNMRYDETVRPALQIIGIDKRYSRLAGIHIIITKQGDTLFFADTTVSVHPTAEDLADIAMMTADVAERFDILPRVAMLSFSDFGSSDEGNAKAVRKAYQIVKQKRPHLIIDGEMQADTAFDESKVSEQFPFSAIKGNANVLIFPDLNSANIAYKMLLSIGGAEYIGPIMMGMNRPVHVLERTADVAEIVSMAVICADEAHKTEIVPVG